MTASEDQLCLQKHQRSSIRKWLGIPYVLKW